VLSNICAINGHALMNVRLRWCADSGFDICFTAMYSGRQFRIEAGDLSCNRIDHENRAVSLTVPAAIPRLAWRR
jgi:hypothetical protein